MGSNISISEHKPLKICFVADGRSPIARNWITNFIKPQHEVHLISSYYCPSEFLAGATINEAPMAFASLAGASEDRNNRSSNINATRSLVLDGLRRSACAKLSSVAQHYVLPFDLQRNVKKVRRLINRISPDVVHAMRVPFEGILAAKATPSGVPLLISVWGNDFTLWASRNPLIAWQTRNALRRANALHCDCRRDLDLAVREWGFDSSKPSVVLPGAGGVQASLFHRGEAQPSIRREMNIADDCPVIFNARGFRGYVRNDVFFKSIPIIIKEYPKAIFLCAAMLGNPIAERWVRQLRICESVRLLPLVPRDRMAALFRLSSVAVSPSLHDGTPNTLLEAMSCGCFPVAGDIESVREWITDGDNGLLCEPKNPESLARAVIRALGDEQLRNRAGELNVRSIAERAEYNKIMQMTEEFYYQIIQRKRRASNQD